MQNQAKFRSLIANGVLTGCIMDLCSQVDFLVGQVVLKFCLSLCFCYLYLPFLNIKKVVKITSYPFKNDICVVCITYGCVPQSVHTLASTLLSI